MTATIAILIAASVATGAAKPAEWTTAPQAQSRALGSQVASCLVKKSRPIVVAALEAPFGDDETPGRFGKVFSARCLDDLLKPKLPTTPSALTFPPLVGRGLLYEALYRADFRKVANLQSISAAQVRYPVAGLDTSASLGRDYAALMRIGECTVRAAPNEARALVLSKVASKQEAVTISAIRNARLACTPPAARQLEFSPTVERGMIAEPLYRLTQASTSLASGSGR